MSLVEVLVAVVLLGTAVVATLTALRGTIIATAIERDHAKAYQWLQSAVGVLQGAERAGCDLGPLDTGYSTGEAKVRETYQQVIRDGVINPDGWGDYQLVVLPPVKVWDGELYWDPAMSPQSCYDSSGFKLQLITIRVTSPDGKIIEDLQVVKDGASNG
ncbi:MAG: hypothetical protein ABIW84_03150 [Ilumatobacteraceae bacterium]